MKTTRNYAHVKSRCFFDFMTPVNHKYTLMTQASAAEQAEQELLTFLLQNPDFFERHAADLAGIRLRHPHSNRVISLQERQAQILRDKLQTQEQRLAQLIQNAQDNTTLYTKLLDLAQVLLRIPDHSQSQQSICMYLRTSFGLQEAVIRLWHTTADAHQSQAWVQGLITPHCGALADTPALASWLPPASEPIQTIALIPLRKTTGICIGALLLGATEEAHFHVNLGTEFLQGLGQLCMAVLDQPSDLEKYQNPGSSIQPTA